MKSNFPNQSDLNFYQSKRMPAWSKKIKKTAHAIDYSSDHIDIVVNSHATVKKNHERLSGECAVHNMMVFVKGWVRRGECVEDRLRELVVNPGCLINPEKRSAIAKRWLKRLTSN